MTRQKVLRQLLLQMHSDSERLFRLADALRERTGKALTQFEDAPDRLELLPVIWLDDIRQTVARLTRAEARYDLLVESNWEETNDT